MSLVAYGSSGESGEESDDASDQDSSLTVPKSVAAIPKIQHPVDRTSINIPAAIPQIQHPVDRTSIHLPAPKHNVTNNIEYEDDIPWETEKRDLDVKNVPSVSLNKNMVNSTASMFASLPPPKQSVCVSEEEDSGKSSKDLFASLPLPKTRTSIERESLDVGLPQQSKIESKTIEGTRARKKPVKIVVPSLSEFKDDEDLEPHSKKLKPSLKGSGLFALLPAPKNNPVKEHNRQLVPHVLTKKPLPQKPKRPVHKNPKSAPQLINYADSGDESDDESTGAALSEDFFSLSSRSQGLKLVNPVPTVTEAASDGTLKTDGSDESEPINIDRTAEMPLMDDKPLSFRTEFQPSPWSGNQSQKPVEGNWQDTTYPEHFKDNISNDLENEDEAIQEESIQLDEEALQRLCGRRGRNRDVQLIDVSGDAVMPDPREWLTKQLTEEKESRSHSHRKKDGPTTQQRRKHQITYLAFQAKEHELELKNQWAQNRMSRKQTQAKYGF